jgi:hypothetical protein
MPFAWINVRAARRVEREWMKQTDDLALRRQRGHHSTRISECHNEITAFRHEDERPIIGGIVAKRAPKLTSIPSHFHILRCCPGDRPFDKGVTRLYTGIVRPMIASHGQIAQPSAPFRSSLVSFDVHSELLFDFISLW